MEIFLPNGGEIEIVVWNGLFPATCDDFTWLQHTAVSLNQLPVPSSRIRSELAILAGNFDAREQQTNVKPTSTSEIEEEHRASIVKEKPELQEEWYVIAWIGRCHSRRYSRKRETPKRGGGVEALAIRSDGRAPSRHDGDPALARDCDCLRCASCLWSDLSDHCGIRLSFPRWRVYYDQRPGRRPGAGADGRDDRVGEWRFGGGLSALAGGHLSGRYRSGDLKHLQCREIRAVFPHLGGRRHVDGDRHADHRQTSPGISRVHRAAHQVHSQSHHSYPRTDYGHESVDLHYSR